MEDLVRQGVMKYLGLRGWREGVYLGSTVVSIITMLLLLHMAWIQRY